MKRLLGILLGAATLSLSSGAAAGAIGGDCSALTITSTAGPKTTTHTLSVEGALPEVIAYAAFSDTPGRTVYDFGTLGSVVFGLDFPIYLVPIGVTDLDGNAALAFDVPTDAPVGWDIHVQAAAFDLILDPFGTPPGPAILSCMSNVVPFSF